MTHKDRFRDEESFNSVIDHQKHIMGMPTKRVPIRSLPLFIRIFYYFIITVVVVGFGLMVYANFFK